MEEKKSSLPLLVIAIVVVGLVAVALAALPYLMGEKTDTDQAQNVAPEAPKQTILTGLEAAERMIGYIESQRIPGGFFNLEEECVINGNPPCESTEEHGHDHDHGDTSTTTRPTFHFGQIIIALDDYAKATNNPVYKDEVNEIMDLIVEDCLNNNNLTVCEWNYYPTYNFYKETGDEKYKNVMLKVEDVVLNPRLSLETTLAKNIGIKLWMLYDVTELPRYRNRLQKLADEALEILPMSPTTPEDIARATKITESMLIPAHKATGDARYLAAVENFYRTNDISGYVTPPDPFIGTQPILLGAESLYYLSQNASVDKSLFYNKYVLTLEELLKYRVDFPESERKFTGDAGMMRHAVRSADAPNIKDTFATGTFIQALLKVPEYRFEIVGTYE